MTSWEQQEIARLKQLIKETKQERQEAEAKTKRTTLQEYLRAHHTSLSGPIRVQAYWNLHTQSSMSRPGDMPRPRLLKPWEDFQTRQHHIFQTVGDCVADKRLFSSLHFIEERGKQLERMLHNRPLASEKTVEIYHSVAVENPVETVIEQLAQINDTRLQLEGSILFAWPVSSLDDSNEEVQAQTSDSTPNPRRTDQRCVYVEESNGAQRLCMLVQYEAADGLTASVLRTGLQRADSGSMNLSEVINRTTIPSNSDSNFVYRSEQLVTTAFAQAYSSMVENGLLYSKITSGPIDVFLKILVHEPHTLYHHLAEPLVEAEAEAGMDILPHRTAVGQTLAFCLMAMRSKPCSQKWRKAIVTDADRSGIGEELTLSQMPEKENTTSPRSSRSEDRKYSVTRSPIMLKSKTAAKRKASYGSVQDQQSPSSSDDDPDAKTSSNRDDHAQKSSKETYTSEILKQATENDIRHRPYCTQACLLGLVREQLLDDSCPNIDAHRGYRNTNHHTMNHKSFVEHMLHQLDEDPDNGILPLGKQGARGALFKLSLEHYEYTFVAKGTVMAFKEDLEHEALVYRHLEKIQGELVPVYLGSISLKIPWYLDYGVRIHHMLLMSWAGERACKDLMTTMGRDLNAEASKIETQILDCGVEHGDVHGPNVLWNPITKTVMLIDFERSNILQEIPPTRKRKHISAS
ncbi:hypothetical protein BU24DRAFT_49433 [Aaosphaeria arxii CBS 175.79]|uniref:Protein kinase domain-containing protein n=1 Tax=Aaosphaeria arxii CBS 175.79 TaxID=1450172 RepID=A0A6A5XD74_9PLEO|nr:uncharacterized protein BU24DRAFT_49433 [Aaosphaeria arxii CBS 175.79]KAF2010948.1 hypothetical protein BU24DRAFT_49433 [Aaosphaeria arxii CBS 175.79]